MKKLRTIVVALALALALTAQGAQPASANLTWEGCGGETTSQNVTWE